MKKRKLTLAKRQPPEVTKRLLQEAGYSRQMAIYMIRHRSDPPPLPLREALFREATVAQELKDQRKLHLTNTLERK